MSEKIFLKIIMSFSFFMFLFSTAVFMWTEIFQKREMLMDIAKEIKKIKTVVPREAPAALSGKWQLIK